MKIAFLTGSLAMGKDGVGDYTRSLADMLTATGHQCLLIALNEASTHEEDKGETALRLSSKQPWPVRTKQALAALRDFQPDWVSLQFVCYGFHPKGLVIGLARHLTPLFAIGRGHIMLHELWIGEATGYGFKDRVIGWWQKWGLLRLLRKLQPACLHTSNPVYREMLNRNGFHALELPLPGNIPVLAPPFEGLESILREHGGPADSWSREAWWVAGIFGTIHPDWAPRPFLDELCSLAEAKNKRLLVLHLGQTPPAGATVWEKLAAEYAQRAAFLALGIQSAHRISAILQALDFGLATSPWTLIGKSGSSAAMLDHGLPVVVTGGDWKLRRGTTPEPAAQALLFRSDQFLKAWRNGTVVRQIPCSQLAGTVEQMLRDLAAA